MKVAIYCRLSEEDRDKSNVGDESRSIQNQKSLLLDYALGKGWEVYRIYSDDNYVGSDRKRPEFMRLLQDAENREFEIILCKSQSRFTREMELVEKYLHHLFPLWGIRFVSVVDNADTNNKGNKKSRQINGLVNEWYLEDMSESIRSVLTSRRKNGFHIGAFALYGYRKDPEHKGRLLVDEEAAAVVREIFTLFAAGYGKTAIARLLNDRGVPNPTAYKQLHGLRYRQPTHKNGSLWKYPAISSILANETYTGNLVQGRYGSVSYKTKQNRPRPKSEWYIVEGTHEPIISRALWEEVQALAAQKSKPFSDGAIGLFAGKTRCMGCGYTLRSSQSRGRRYLKCPSRQVAKNACTGSFIPVDRLEETVLYELNRLCAQYLDPEMLARLVPFRDGLPERQKRLSAALHAYEKELAGYAKAFRELYMDKVKGLLTAESFAELSQSLSAERERLERLAAESRRQLSALESRRTEETGDQTPTRLKQLPREAVEILIDCIIVGKRASGSSCYPIEIHWSF
ncbi:MAG: recombinase family protein [Provencibacterium sp.]|jgi:site-specific DNA recombinase|nr:recombinase family protein [Provencibacterium sp.]